MNWNPHTLQHCLDSDALAYLTAGLAAGMLYWYLRIAGRWYHTANTASPAGRNVWLWLMGIFIVCAMAGYTSWIFATFAPKFAAIFRIAALAILNVVCPMFWYTAVSKRFDTMGRYDRIGSSVVEAVAAEAKTSAEVRAAILTGEAVKAASELKDVAEHAAEAMIHKASDTSATIGDRELASLVRTLVAESVRRAARS